MEATPQKAQNQTLATALRLYLVRPDSPWSCLDLFLPVAMLGANFLLARTDPGLLAFQPTPWIILPVLFGLRRGVLWGWGAAITVFLFIAGANAGGDLSSWKGFLGDHRGLLLSFLILGSIAGEAHALWWKEIEREQDHLTDSNSQARASRKRIRKLQQGRERLTAALEISEAKKHARLRLARR